VAEELVSKWRVVLLLCEVSYTTWKSSTLPGEADEDEEAEEVEMGEAP